MPDPTELKDLKQQIQASIRRNSDRGFVPYSRCIQVSKDLMAVAEISSSIVSRRSTRSAASFPIQVRDISLTP
jgi:hypothetical protein